MLCCGIKELGRPPLILSLRDYPSPSKDPLHIDKRLMENVRNVLDSYDYLITWNGIMFDIPYINDRLLLTHQNQLSKKFHSDIMYMVRMGKSTFTSSRLDWASRVLGCASKKTPLDINTWKCAEVEARTGFKTHKNFDEIIHHNKMDLAVTEQVYNRVKSRIQTISKR
jgi:uncharacterized protein YprB with RNaseH-like and TPR domain